MTVQPIRPIIEDTWPECACRGKTPKALEHGPRCCSVLPAVLAQALTEDRRLTDAEQVAMLDAMERRSQRGWGSGSASDTTETFEALRAALGV